MQPKTIIPLLILALIVLFAAFLRLANLESNPNGLYVDEASTGYNAYSILETGKDEYGKQSPLAFRFLGSYTPPVYTYLTVIVMKFFGLSIFSTRFLSAVSGIALVILTFFIVKNIISNKFLIPHIGALLIAISPWSIFYSRIGYEIHLAFLIYASGVFALWKSLKNRKILIFAFFLLSLSAITYHAERLLAPLTIIVFLFIFRKGLIEKKNIKLFIFGKVIYLLISLPQFLIFFTPANTSRGLGLFYSEAVSNAAMQIKFLPTFVTIPASFLREFSAQYISYFSPRNLFFEGDSDLQRSIPEVSVFYPWSFIFFIIGLFALFKHKNDSSKKFILMLLMLAPIPASLTGDPFSTQRSLPLLLPLVLIVIFGIYQIIQKYIWQVAIFLIIIAPITFLQLYRGNAVLLPNERAVVWGYGFSQLADEVKKRPSERFVIDSSRIKPAYIELAFFLKYPPDKFQKEVDQTIKNNYYTATSWDSHYKFGQVETRNIYWEKDVYEEKIMVGDELAISKEQAEEHFLKEEFSITSPTGEIIFRGFKTNPRLKYQNEKK